tara:strand:- start:1108 stop:1815 length:708 start_codon:yes stop_codon:yes gene_type:complete
MKSDNYNIKVITDKPVALDSPDHTDPHGTANDNTANPSFVTELNNYFDRPINYLDLGCSGGQFVVDMMKDNNLCVGLEGSDYSIPDNQKKYEEKESNQKRFMNWKKYYNKNLFTCDISEPFSVQSDDIDVKFNLISAWEVLEHIPANKLDNLFQNIYKHLTDDGIFVGSISLSEEKWHLTVEEPPFWEDVFKRNGFKMVGEDNFYDSEGPHHYLFKHRLRGKFKNSFWTTLQKDI